MKQKKKNKQTGVNETGDVNSTSVPVSPPNPILNEKAAEYLRESGNIEDVPNAEEQEEVDKTISQTKKQQ